MIQETVVDVVRHGRTVLNEQGRFRGLHDVPLDDRGRAEADALALLLRVRSVVVVFHSPLTRARQTAEPIARRRGIDPVPLASLLDLDHGEWTALSHADAERRDPEEYERFRWDPRASTPPGGEPLIEAEQRIVGTIDELSRRYPGREIAVVSHEVPIRLLLSHLTGLDGAGLWNIPLPTGSVARLRGSAGSWRVEEGPSVP
ncbi:MAG: histidine phosphatase family protein [Actinomycetota bacterium]|nr:histidine phosphatase family protein [Actinomycetota bacterium]